MKIRIVLEVDDDSDIDEASSTGLTTEAYDRLYEAITDVGFGFDSGPDVVPE